MARTVGPFVVALTGGIGSGKTAVSDAFAALGVSVIDTDIVARELVEPGKPALADIAVRFGSDCLQDDGSLNRHRLRNIIFSDSSARAALEAILHPRIRDTVRARLAELQAEYCIVAVPLLAESGSYEFVDRVLVVDVPEEVQIERVIARDGIDAAQARSILAAQATRDQRLAIADDVFDNGGSLEQLKAHVADLHPTYLRMAQQAREEPDRRQTTAQ